MTTPPHGPDDATPPVPTPPTVASVPSDHPYVRHLAPLDGPGPLRLPDIPGVDADGVPTGAWWPPRMLEADWAATGAFDLLHVHFGFESRTPEQLRELVDVLRRRRRGLVVTVHDLHNPHLHDASGHHARLDVLVPAADEVVTLTPGAAAVVAQRWGRTATVVPHPHIVALDEIGPWRARRRPPREPGAPMRVGVSLKSLRANVAARDLLPGLTEAVGALPGATLEISVHADVLRTDAPRHDPAVVGLLDEAGSRPYVEVRAHDYLPDDELWARLASLDVSVLPYRFGTHSGWLEACRDLGTDVVAPRCGGFFAEQAPVDEFDLDVDGLSVPSLAAALRATYERGSRPQVTVEERRSQRVGVAAAHAEVYERARASARAR